MDNVYERMNEGEPSCHPGPNPIRATESSQVQGVLRSSHQSLTELPPWASRSLALICTNLLLLLPTAACSVGHKATHTPRAAIEQLLLNEAAERSVHYPGAPQLPIPEGAQVVLDVTGLTNDRDTLRRIVAGWLGKQGFIVRDNKEKADYRLEIMTQALGTEYDYTFIGMPSLQSVFIPFALPELALYSAKRQTGYARFYLNVVNTETDKFVATTPVYLGETYHNNYTVMFIFSFRSTNLILPPEAGDIHDPAKTKGPISTHTPALE